MTSRPRRPGAYPMRAVQYRAALDRIRTLHAPVEDGRRTLCSHCSAHDGERPTLPAVRYPCPTIQAIDEPKEPTS